MLYKTIFSSLGRNVHYVTGRQENSDSTAHSYPAAPTAEQSHTNNPTFQATKRQMVY